MMNWQEGGSSSLKALHEISPLEGIKSRLKNKVEIVYARGYVGDSSNEYNGVITRQNLKDNRSAKELIDEAIKISQDADYVIFIGGLNKKCRTRL